MKRIIREITPINNDDFFVLLNHPTAGFDFLLIIIMSSNSIW